MENITQEKLVEEVIEFLCELCNAPATKSGYTLCIDCFDEMGNYVDDLEEERVCYELVYE